MPQSLKEVKLRFTICFVWGEKDSGIDKLASYPTLKDCTLKIETVLRDCQTSKNTIT